MSRFVWAIVALALFAAPIDAQKANSLKKLKGRLNSVKGRRSQIQKQLKQTKTQVRVVKGDLNSIDSRLTQLESDLESTTTRLQKAVALGVVVGKELADASARLTKTRAQVSARLRWMYTHPEGGAAQALLGSTSLADFSSRGFLLQRIAHADRSLFDRFTRERADVAAKKRRADALVAEVSGLKRRQESQQSSLNETREDKTSLLGQLQERQADLEKLVRQMDAEEDSIRSTIAAYYRSQKGRPPTPRYTGRFGRPSSGHISSGFGMRFHPILKRNRMHTGVDFGAPYGSAIYAAADGVVIAANAMRGYGNTIMIDHGGSISTLYGHCSRIAVSQGQHVRRGQRIGSVGSTGLSTGPHLHFEVRVNGSPRNPMGWL